MRLWVIGGDGQLGRWLVRLARARPGCELADVLGRDRLDLADPSCADGLFQVGADALPDAVVNAAAFTAVDRCESEEPLARRVNAEAPGRLAARCRERGVRFVHVSTDFVFDGRARRPYREEDPPRPLGAYGRTKREGEERVLEACPAALVVRTSWVFGPGRNFVRTMVEQAERRLRGEAEGPLRVVADQRGRPTYAADLADALLQLAGTGASGLLHWCNDGEASWYELARAALEEAGCTAVAVEPIRAEEWPRPAPVPAYSVLDIRRARSLGVGARPWREALADYLGSEDSPVTREAA